MTVNWGDFFWDLYLNCISFGKLAIIPVLLTFLFALFIFLAEKKNIGKNPTIAQPDDVITNYWTALYFTWITFLTVGYGDYKPRTSCARFFSVLTGILGILCLGLWVAILTRAMDNNAHLVTGR